MCKSNKTLKLCTCSDDIDKSKDHWILERKTVEQKIPSSVPKQLVGSVFRPENLLLLGSIQEQLNMGNVFDFYYDPVEGDLLTLVIEGERYPFIIKQNKHKQLQFEEYLGLGLRSTTQHTLAKKGKVLLIDETALSEEAFILNYYNKPVDQAGLLEAYYHTQFICEDYPDNPIRLYQSCNEWYEILNQYQSSICAVITAYNPFSRHAEDDENQLQQTKLANKLQSEGYSILPGAGTSGDKRWQEPSFFVFGTNKDTLESYLNEFEQTAGVLIESGKMPRLIFSSQ